MEFLWNLDSGFIEEWSSQKENWRQPSACSARAETIVYDRGLLLLAGLVWKKNTGLTENLRSFTTKRTGRLIWHQQESHKSRPEYEWGKRKEEETTISLN